MDTLVLWLDFHVVEKVGCCKQGNVVDAMELCVVKNDIVPRNIAKYLPSERQHPIVMDDEPNIISVKFVPFMDEYRLVGPNHYEVDYIGRFMVAVVRQVQDLRPENPRHHYRCYASASARELKVNIQYAYSYYGGGDSNAKS